MVPPSSRHLRVIHGTAGATAAAAPSTPLTFDAVFRTHARFVAGVALRVLGRTREVEDLVQDVFLRVIDRLDDLRDPEAIRGWLAMITARLARRRLRSRKMQMWLGVGADHDYGAQIDPAISPEERAFVGELYRALDRLPVRQRLAWTLRHLEGFELGLVAQACNCSLATVKRWIAAAAATLRAEVEHE